MGDEGEQQEEDCDYGGDDASRDLRSVETGSYSKRRNSTHIANCTHRRDMSHNVARRVMDLKIPSVALAGNEGASIRLCTNILKYT